MFTIKGKMIGQAKPLVCVSLLGKNVDDVCTQAKKLISDRIPLLELRADIFLSDKADEVAGLSELEQTLKELEKLCEYTVLILTYRTKAEGGAGETDAVRYEKLLSEFCVYADITDVEPERLDDKVGLIEDIHSKGKRVIASFHSFERALTREETAEKLEELKQTGADIVKLAMTAQTRSDVCALMAETDAFSMLNIHTPVITMAMGGIGAFSRITGELFSSAVTFGADGTVSAPGQIDYKSLMKLIDELHGCMETKKNIYLTGFMGTGKSSVGAILQEKYENNGYTFSDTDEEIVKGEGMSIPEIFDRFGEKGFRDIETDYLNHITKRTGQIVSCGGGIVLRDENIRLMKESGTVVLLTASPDILAQRLNGDTQRPLIKNKKSAADIADMLEKRKERYELAADITVNTDNISISEAADQIIMMIGEKEK